MFHERECNAIATKENWPIQFWFVVYLSNSSCVTTKFEGKDSFFGYSTLREYELLGAS